MPRITGKTDERQSEVLSAFLRTQDYELGAAEWINRGLNVPIDLICPERKIGIELVEWIDPAWAQWVNERERFRDQINEEIERRGLTQFTMGGNESKLTIEVSVSDLPRRGEKQQVIQDFINFLVEFELRHRQQIHRPGAIAQIPKRNLPLILGSHFEGITIYEFPMCNLGIIVRGGRFPSTALESLRATLESKIIKKADTYLTEKRSLDLSQLWLVVHYSSPGIYAAPIREENLEVGYGRREAQEAVAERAKVVVEEIGGGGPFDHVFLLIDCQPDPNSFVLWPRS